ncbi:hypothetical protein B0H14DRAFT_2576376 [Mycena olivaceomarginata]|nr:hypothetical protein B0H14DRAFT_2576376 [Mycena olivaceomarginata]
MLWGQPQLDPDLKQQHLQDPRKWYEESYKHYSLKIIAFILNNLQANGKCSQEHEERCAANIIKKRARYIAFWDLYSVRMGRKHEEEDLRRKHKPTTKLPPIPRAKLLLLAAKPPH